jgi:phosphatidylinositol-3,4,5-trisphosphate 3-phosphatase/dual-specificity protein phosphatase PTEN
MQQIVAVKGASPILADNPLTNRIRALVSKKKIRWRADGYDLDLTYITGRLIAMGYPSDDIEGIT